MGNVIKLQSGRTVDEGTKERFRRYLDGELTWAEVEGMTAEQAQRIAQLACGLATGGRLHDARVILEGLVAGNPKDVNALTALAGVLVKLQRRAEALDCFDRAIALFAHNAIAFAGRGELRLRAGDAGGIEDLARAVELDGKGASHAGRRARTLLGALARARPARTQARVAGGRR